MAKAKTPADLTITPRDRRFGRDGEQARWWLNGDPFATAFHNSLSSSFPKGEAFFIESVKQFRDGAPPKLDAEIRAFTEQEVMHSREHVAFNKRATDSGYDFTLLDRSIEETLAIIRSRPPIVNLAATMALEHYTAIMASMMLRDGGYMKRTDPAQAELWRWHAIEELEHKGVAYDTWLHATRDWTRWRRWKLKALMMSLVTMNFWRRRVAGALELLRQDGITGWRAKWGITWYLLGWPGIFRRVLPSLLAYYLPGFHPWNHDDRKLIGKADSDYAAAAMASAA